MSLLLSTHKQKMLTPEEEAELIQQWVATRDTNPCQKTLLRLMRAFSPLVAKYVRKYAAYGIAREELLSVGNLALIETAYRFKPELRNKFSTYSSRWIQGTMLIYIASNYFSFALKSQKMKKVFFKLRRLVHEQQNQDDDVHTMMEKLASHFGMSASRLEQIYDLIQHPVVSVQQPVMTSKGERVAEFGDMLPNEDPDPETSLIDKRMEPFRPAILMSVIQEALNERERIIITGRILAKPEEAMTLQDLANRFNLSRERVRQISNTALEKLERAIRAKCPDMEPTDYF